MKKIEQVDKRMNVKKAFEISKKGKFHETFVILEMKKIFNRKISKSIK
jgi:hypothetical protein